VAAVAWRPAAIVCGQSRPFIRAVNRSGLAAAVLVCIAIAGCRPTASEQDSVVQSPPAPMSASACHVEFEFAGAFGGCGDDQKFGGPIGLRIAPDQNLYVVDDLGHRVYVLTPEGRCLRTLGRHGTGRGELAWPDAVAFDTSGALFVADTGNNRIQVWDSSGTFLREFGRLAARRWRSLQNPRDVIVTPMDEVIVADFTGKRVQVFDTDGRWLRNLPRAEDSVILGGPVGLAYSADRLLYVSDTQGDQVVVFNRDGSLHSRIDGQGTEGGRLNAPHGLAISPRGCLIVAEAGSGRLRVFTLDGRSGREIAQPDGPVRVTRPLGLALDADGRLYIADAAAHQVVAWRPRQASKL
jgi:DNA-binding beta-propeller fold protein YncE